MRRFAWPLASLAFVMAPLAAQDTGTPLTINLGGASAGVAVEASTGSGRVALGRAAPGAPLTVLASALNAGKGQRVNATVDRSGPEPKLVLVPEGTTDATCEAAEARREDACDVVGGFPWGETPRLGFTLSGGALTLSTGMTYATRRPNRFTLGIGYVGSSFTKAEEIGCDQPGIASCTAETGGSGIHAFGEYALTDQIRFGLGYRRGRFSVDQAYADATQRHEVTVSSYESYLQVRPIQGRRVVPFFMGGWGWWCNESEILDASTLLGTRGQSGGRLFGDVGLEVPQIVGGLGGRVMGGYATGGGGDADSAFRYSLNLIFNF